MKLEDQLSRRGVFGAKMNSPLFELAHLLVRFDHVARFIENANHRIMRAAEKLCVSGLEAAI